MAEDVRALMLPTMKKVKREPVLVPYLFDRPPFRVINGHLPDQREI